LFAANTLKKEKELARIAHDRNEKRV
jgi:hypothetical protein